LRWRGSNVVLALDPPPHPPQRLLRYSTRILEEVAPYICAVKLNRQLVLPLGLPKAGRLVKLIHDMNLPVIMDCKLNDVGHTNRAIAELYFNAGFDALTANPFTGWEDGLQPVFSLAQEMGRGILLLVYMSHRGASEGYGQLVQDPKSGRPRPQYLLFAEKALRWGADGVIVGATQPQRIREVHSILGDKVPIYAPGIGPQGGVAQSAVRAGARFLIVGRAILHAERPGEEARRIRDLAGA